MGAELTINNASASQLTFRDNYEANSCAQRAPLPPRLEPHQGTN